MYKLPSCNMRSFNHDQLLLILDLKKIPLPVSLSTCFKLLQGEHDAVPVAVANAIEGEGYRGGPTEGDVDQSRGLGCHDRYLIRSLVNAAAWVSDWTKKMCLALGNCSTDFATMALAIFFSFPHSSPYIAGKLIIILIIDCVEQFINLNHVYSNFITFHSSESVLYKELILYSEQYCINCSCVKKINNP